MSFCKINRKFIPLTAILTFSTLVIIKIAAFPASKIPFGNYELIDEYLLATTPLASIFCLSSQPPGHNTVIVLSLHIGKHLKIEPGFIFATLTYLIGSLGAASLAYLFATLGMGGEGFCSPCFCSYILERLDNLIIMVTPLLFFPSSTFFSE